MKRKILSILLSVAMVMVMMPSMAFASSVSNCTDDCKHEAAIGNTHYDTLEEAIAAVATSATKDITLLKNVEVTEQINLPADVTLDGGGYKITANNSSWNTTNGSKMLLEIETKATVKNVTLDSNNQACGVQAYTATGVNLNNVTITNSKNAGLTINASQVTVSGTLTMSGNAWGNHINLGWGSDIANAPDKCTINFSSAELIGVTSIWTDKDDLSRAGVEQVNWKDKFSVTGLSMAPTKAGDGIACVPAVASVGNVNYATLSDAITNVPNKGTITILRDIEKATGLAVDTKKEFTVDFDGHTYTASKPAAGSKGTETNMFQLKKDQKITFKNGTLNCAEDNLIPEASGKNIKRIIQNYAELTLENMTIDGSNLYDDGNLVMSFNHQPVNIIGNTSIKLKAGATKAFDADGNWSGYDRCKVTVNTTGTIEGNIEVGQGYLNVINGNIGGISLCTLCGDNETSGQLGRISISGGSFSSNPTTYVADDAKVYHTSTGMYNVNNTAHTGGNNTWTYNEGTKLYEESYVAPPTTPTEKDPVSNEGTAGTDNATTNADITDKVTTSDGKTEAVVDQVIADKIVDKAVENKSTEVVVEATTAAGKSDASQVALPETTVKAIAEQTDAAITIKTDNAEVTLDKEAVNAVADQAGTTGTVKLVVETVENTAEKVVVELKLETSNGYVSDFKGGNVSVTVPVAKDMADKKVVCVYIDDNGIYHKVDGAMNEAGTHYTFTTGHFSTYAIMSEEEADAVIKDQTAAAQKAAIKNVKTTVTLSTKNVKKGIKVTVKVPVDQKADKTGIILYRSMKKGSGYAMYKKVETKSSTYIITNTKNVKGNRLTAGKRYYYKARAYKVIDGKTYYGPMSTVKYMKAK